MAIHDEVTVDAHGAELGAALAIPDAARGLVIFAHGSGSGRASPRNQRVARALERAGVASLLVDLLTRDEERADRATFAHRFDVTWLADRLIAVTHWARLAGAPGLPIGYFGASTGAAAALIAAAREPFPIGAIVSRGGRPDLAGAALAHVRAPTLLVVGGADRDVLAWNRAALVELRVAKALEIVPRAGHLFEEPGALEHVAALAAAWFERHLGGRAASAEADHVT